MKRSFPIALVAALALCVMALPALAHEGGTAYEIVAPKAASAPTMDGVLNDQAWLDAKLANAVAAGFVSSPGTMLPEGQTMVYATWDDEALYLAYSNYRDMDRVTMMEDGNVLFGQEDENEVYIDWAHSQTQATRVQFAWDAYGAMFATAGFSTEGMEVATSRTNYGWFAEVKIPWENVNISEPEEGLLIGINFTGYTTQDRVYIAWSPTFGTFDNPSMFGHLVLGGPY